MSEQVKIRNTKVIVRTIVCPNCHGSGRQQKPPGMPGEITIWTIGGENCFATYECEVCEGKKTIQERYMDYGSWFPLCNKKDEKR